MKKYNHKKIEKKWQKYWSENLELSQAQEVSDKEKFYCLDMFPYPSGAGLHVGHVENYTATDIYSRFKRMNGFNVLHPIGWDAFGLPAENFAIKQGIHPNKSTHDNIKNFIKQIKSIGISYDWSREIDTSSPEYYKWTQWFFLFLYNNGLAYKKKAKANWCESCKTVVANEQVVDGKCDRCGGEIIQKDLEQWFFKITDFIEDFKGLNGEEFRGLINGLDKVDWPNSTKIAQKNWIGKSVGTTISFKVVKRNNSLLSSVNIKDSAQHSSQTIAESTQSDTENDLLYKDLTYKIRGAFFNVRKEMGLGHKESVYHKALEIEFKKQGLSFESEKKIDVRYEGKKVGIYQPDFVVDNKILIELKALPKIGKQELNQAWTYLKGSEYKLALLVNFSPSDLEIKRIVYDIARENNYSASSASVLSHSATSIEVFTTRVDTIFGCTYVVLAPESKLASELKEQAKNKEEIEKYINETKKKTDLERMENKEKTGVEIKGVRAVNPFNNEAVPIYVADYVIGTYGTGAVMAVPAHDERDFEFAQKYNLPIRQSIAPFFIGKEKNETLKNKEIIKRKSVDVIIKHWEKDEYYCLDWKFNNWKSFVVGGVRDDETLEDAVLREAREETGYKNMRIVSRIGGEIHSQFFAVHKDINRYSMRNCFYVELIDDEFKEPEERHVKNHQGKWIKKENVNNFLTLTEPIIYWDIYLNGEKATTEDGVVVNSGDFTGLSSEDAREKMTAWLEENKLGERKVNYRLRDWLVSRQRYWGSPIPIIYCDKCGEVPVPEKDLPVTLPTDVDFKPTGESPLAISKSFHDVTCPLCGEKARRESDTMDTFVCSSWYYLRFADPKNKEEFASKENLEKWLPVDLYMGGAEHTVLHLLYARFFTKALAKYGYIKFDEPFLKLRHQGMIMAEDGRKMSKSLGNVVNPDDVVENFGADALRLYEMFMGPIDEMKAWSMQNVNGPKNFLDKVWKIFSEKELIDCGNGCEGVAKELPTMLHKTIKKVTADIEGFNFNTAISQMMIFVNEFSKHDKLPKEAMEKFLILLSPFAPHMAEEIWQEILEHKKSIFLEKWPEFKEELTKDEEVEMVVQVNGKIRDRIRVNAKISEEEAKKIALESKKVKLYIEGKEIRKIIYVKGKLVSIVI